MEQTREKCKFTHILEVPPYWLKAPNMGQPIQFPLKPNLFFIPMKIPFSQRVQEFAKKKSWTIHSAIKTASEMLKINRPEIKFIHVTFYEYWTIDEDDYVDDVELHFVPFENNYQKIIDYVLNLISKIPSPSYPYVMLLSDSLGYNLPGLVISAAFCHFLNYPVKASTFLFAKKREPGIFSQKCIDVLNHKYPIYEPASASQKPEFFKPFPILSNDTPIHIPIDNTLNLIADGGTRIFDKQQINTIDNLLRENAGAKRSKLFFFSDGDILPMRSHSPQNYLEDSSKIRITFCPVGENLFFIINGKDGYYLFLPPKKLWFFKANIELNVDHVICTAIITKKEHRKILFLTDILLFGEMNLNSTELDYRASILYYKIIRNVKNSSLKIAYRPFTTLKYLTPLEREFQNPLPFNGIQCDGAAIYCNDFPVGPFLPLPNKSSCPILTLYVVANTYNSSILYAKDDTTLLYIMVMIYEPSDPTVIAEINRKVVRFRIKDSKPQIECICNDFRVSLLSCVKSVLKSLDNPQSLCLKNLKQFVNK